jgi:hypothetical protein
MRGNDDSRRAAPSAGTIPRGPPMLWSWRGLRSRSSGTAILHEAMRLGADRPRPPRLSLNVTIRPRSEVAHDDLTRARSRAP